jgi:hypothetical protein
MAHEGRGRGFRPPSRPCGLPRSVARAPLGRSPRTAVRQASLPPSPRSAAGSLPGFAARRSARWCHPTGTGDQAARPCFVWAPTPAPPLYDAAAATGPRNRRRGLPRRPVLFPAGPAPPPPRASARDPPGATPPGAVPVAAPAAFRHHAVPVGLAACRQGPDWSRSPAQGSRRLPTRLRRGCRLPSPLASAGHPADSPSYACKRSEPPRCQQLFPDFFQDLFLRPHGLVFPQVNGVKSADENLPSARTADAVAFPT